MKNFDDEFRYSVVYKGYLFDGDNVDGYNTYGTDSWDDAISLYYRYHSDGMDIYIRHNEYGVTFEDGEWS